MYRPAPAAKICDRLRAGVPLLVLPLRLLFFPLSAPGRAPIAQGAMGTRGGEGGVRWGIAALLMLALATLPSHAALAQTAYAPPSAKSGAKLIVREGCGTCHVIPGIRGARGEVGPPLNAIAERTFLAGVLPNTPQNMALWLKNPQAIVPGNAMPDMHLSNRDAADIAAYLATLH